MGISPVPVPITFNPYFQAELGAEVSYHGTALVEKSSSSIQGTDMVHENALITNDNPTTSVQDNSVLLQTNTAVAAVDNIDSEDGEPSLSQKAQAAGNQSLATGTKK